MPSPAAAEPGGVAARARGLIAELGRSCPEVRQESTGSTYLGRRRPSTPSTRRLQQSSRATALLIPHTKKRCSTVVLLARGAWHAPEPLHPRPRFQRPHSHTRNAARSVRNVSCAMTHGCVSLIGGVYESALEAARVLYARPRPVGVFTNRLRMCRGIACPDLTSCAGCCLHLTVKRPTCSQRARPMRTRIRCPSSSTRTLTGVSTSSERWSRKPI